VEVAYIYWTTNWWWWLRVPNTAAFVPRASEPPCFISFCWHFLKFTTNYLFKYTEAAATSCGVKCLHSSVHLDYCDNEDSTSLKSLIAWEGRSCQSSFMCMSLFFTAADLIFPTLIVAVQSIVWAFTLLDLINILLKRLHVRIKWMEFYMSKVNSKYYVQSFDILTLCVIFTAEEKKSCGVPYDEHKLFCLYEQTCQNFNVKWNKNTLY